MNQVTEWPEVPEQQRRGPIKKVVAKYCKNFKPIAHESDFLPLTKPRDCPYCSYRAQSKPLLKIHVNDCHEFMNWFSCPVNDCQKPFLAFSSLVTHCKKWHDMKDFGEKEEYQITDKDVIHNLRGEHINNKVMGMEKKVRSAKHNPY